MKAMVKALLNPLLKFFNFTVSVRYNRRAFRIPVIRKTGLTMLYQKEKWMGKLLESLALPDQSSFVDVGTNLGQTLLYFKSVYDLDYFGFEPNAHCLSYIDTLIRMNRITRTTLIPVGLSHTTGIQKLYRKDESDSGATIIENFRPGHYSDEDVSSIPVFRFDDLGFWKDHSVSLVKIDVEGAESFVLEGMEVFLTTQQPAIICEVLDADSEEFLPDVQQRADAIVGNLKRWGYMIYRVNHGNDTIGFEELDSITLKAYGPESVDANDYLFVPREFDIAAVERNLAGPAD